MSLARPNKRARSAIACRRCKQRKQRCDNGFPACAACVAASATCSYESNVYPEEHVETLRARVADLERQLHTQKQLQGHSVATVSPAVDSSSGRPSGLQDSQPVAPLDQCADDGYEDPGGEDRGEDEANTAFDMLSPGASYLGFSSGFPLARSVHAAIGPTPLSHRQSSRTDSARNSRPWNIASDFLPITRPKSANSLQLSQFLDAYLSKVHPKHMFISSRRLFRLHESREALLHAARPPKRNAVLSRCQFLLLHMVYAIGARYIQLSREQSRFSSEAHYALAVEDIQCLFETRGLESVEGLLMLVIFQLRFPSPPGIWSVVGTAMRHAISIGLHRRFNGTSLVMDQRRKRVFWTIYMLDRSMARTLGRPVCISDRDIDVDLPANVSVDIEEEEEMVAALQADPGPTPMAAAIHLFRLSRIESKIYSTIHRVDLPLSDLKPAKVAQLRQQLDDWRDQIPVAVPSANDYDDLPNYYVKPNYYVLQYHKAMLLVLLPCLPRLPVTHPDFRLCIASAGQVGQLYKSLHDHQSSLSYSLIALHATFVAGLTLIYCFLADKTIFDLHFSSDIRACSTVLYVISERWSAARKIRDAFERMISNTVEKDQFRNSEQGASQGGGQLMDGRSADVLETTADHHQTDVLWSELATLIPPHTEEHSTSFVPMARDNPSEDLWATLGSWFGETEDSWLESNWDTTSVH
ncbi:hypothetical protein PV08_05129 [Exophiala spinifera]|uniref:Zn(2)-C6 fungal-type domain-containing protein n=1 Tax=Exophiala spinifera TaxID=91928 RepID=A0A0D2C2U6_9EURO|nr:uncharacterized protein PV08_05129 [Exophiala spinifera]KIW17934.1 hypothetical protein PV08_05129 [Exophiala spinifera]